MVGPDQLTAWADASKVAPRHSAVRRVLAQADAPVRDLLPALLPRGGSHKCEVLIDVARCTQGRILGSWRLWRGRCRRSRSARCVELTLQLLALEGATPMWPKFQHFAVDIPGTTEKQSA